MTPEQALEQLDSLIAQVKNPPLNRAEQVHMQKCVEILRGAIKKPEPTVESESNV